MEIPFEAKTNVNKIVIVAYKDKTAQEQSKDVKPFVIPVNPENYSHNYKVEYDVRRGQGQQRTEVKFKSTAPEELKLEFVFDGTGVIQDYYKDKKDMPVKNQVALFLNTVYNMSGEIHMPRYLKLFWGKNFMIQCVLTNLDINYTLFDEAGDPLRAKISATFLDHIAKEQRVAREGKRSPDLSHIREVKGDDRLDTLSYEVYNDSKYMLQVAKANGLTMLRNVPTGTTLLFPPFDKTEQ